MIVRSIGSSMPKLQFFLLEGLEHAGFEVKSRPGNRAELIFDFCTRAEWLGAPGLELRGEGEALILSLCHRSGVTETARNLTANRIVGFSLVPPIGRNSIVELARPLGSKVETLEEAKGIFEQLGLHTVEVPDGPGLIGARILACLVNEAMSALAQGVADALTIDQAMKLGTNYPQGPLAWAEELGLEAVLGLLEALQVEYGEERYRPHPLLKQLSRSGISPAEFRTWGR